MDSIAPTSGLIQPAPNVQFNGRIDDPVDEVPEWPTLRFEITDEQLRQVEECLRRGEAIPDSLLLPAAIYAEEHQMLTLRDRCLTRLERRLETQAMSGDEALSVLEEAHSRGWKFLRIACLERIYETNVDRSELSNELERAYQLFTRMPQVSSLSVSSWRYEGQGFHIGDRYLILTEEGSLLEGELSEAVELFAVDNLVLKADKPEKLFDVLENTQRSLSLMVKDFSGDAERLIAALKNNHAVRRFDMWKNGPVAEAIDQALVDHPGIWETDTLEQLELRPSPKCVNLTAHTGLDALKVAAEKSSIEELWVRYPENEEEADALVRVLENNPITELRIFARGALNQWEVEVDFPRLNQWIEQDSTLRVLATMLSNPGLIQAVQHNPNIEAIRIAQVSQQHADAVLEMVKNRPNLTQVPCFDFLGRRWELLEAMRGNTNLTRLDLNFTADVELESLQSMFPSLTVLDVWCEDGVLNEEVIQQLLATPLTGFDYTGSNLDLVAKLIQQSETLQDLFVEGREIRPIIDALSGNPKLETLFLSAQLDADDFAALISGLKANTHLRTFFLGNNMYGPTVTDLTGVREALEANTTLRKLALTDTGVSFEVAFEVFSALKVNRTLSEVEFVCRGLSDEQRSQLKALIAEVHGVNPRVFIKVWGVR